MRYDGSASCREQEGPYDLVIHYTGIRHPD
jgi:hypothetical protein